MLLFVIADNGRPSKSELLAKQAKVSGLHLMLNNKQIIRLSLSRMGKIEQKEGKKDKTKSSSIST